MKDDKYRLILELLCQLLKYTEQLARCEEDPTVDVEALSLACEERLAVLKSHLPINERTMDDREGMGEELAIDGEILSKMRTLGLQTEHCIKVLERCRAHAESGLSNVRNVRKAVRAYGAFSR